MLKQVLHGRRILVANHNYFTAHAIGCFLYGAGAEILGPVPSNEDALQLLSSAPRPDAAVVKQQLRDGSAHETILALNRLQIPYILAAAGAPPSQCWWGEAPILFTPGAELVRLILTTIRAAAGSVREEAAASKALPGR